MSSHARRLIYPLAGLAFAVTAGYSSSEEQSKTVFVPLIDTSVTVMGEPIVYPKGKAKILTGIVTMPPGAKSGWHTHAVPVTGIIMSGELTVDYGKNGKRVYREGDSIAEAMAVPHWAENTGSVPMKLFIVYMGAEGIANDTPVEAPAGAQ